VRFGGGVGRGFGCGCGVAFGLGFGAFGFGLGAGVLAVVVWVVCVLLGRATLVVLAGFTCAGGGCGDGVLGVTRGGGFTLSATAARVGRSRVGRTLSATTAIPTAAAIPTPGVIRRWCGAATTADGHSIGTTSTGG
jgi:hypothetical protein